MLFTFAGSSHSEYTNYLLETICNLELESSKELQEAILKSTLINLSGCPGAFSAADIIQEFFNRSLEATIEWKGAEFGSDFIRRVVSPNLHHFAHIKLDLCEGVGLAKRSGKHTEPHLRPEVQILLETYQKCELHRRRPGRVYSEQDKDDFSRGMNKLQAGKLKKWAVDTTRHQDLGAKVQEGVNTPPQVPNDMMDVDEEDPMESEIYDQPTLGFMEIVDRELVIGTEDTLATDIDTWMAQIEEGTGINMELLV
jgi:hypothetical protein